VDSGNDVEVQFGRLLTHDKVLQIDEHLSTDRRLAQITIR
jgi:hypothetical protein